MISQTAIENQQLGSEYSVFIRVALGSASNYILSDEKLTCFATFTSEETGQNYLIGALEEPYITDLTSKLKCFLYAETDDGGFSIAQNEDASCEKLVDVETDGIRNIQMTVGKLCYFCLLPSTMLFLWSVARLQKLWEIPMSNTAAT